MERNVVNLDMADDSVPKDVELKRHIAQIVNRLLGPVGNTMPAKNVGPAHPLVEEIIKTVRATK